MNIPYVQPKPAKYGPRPNMAPSHNTIPYATTWIQVGMC